MKTSALCLAGALASGAAAPGCSAEANTQSARPAAISKAPSPLESPRDAAPESRPEAPTLDALALLAPSLAPGLREVARGESALPASITLPSATSDVCLRMVFAASAPVVAALVSEGRLLAVSESARLTSLDARGPICLKRASPARIDVQGPEGPVRYVLWMTP